MTDNEIAILNDSLCIDYSSESKISISEEKKFTKPLSDHQIYHQLNEIRESLYTFTSFEYSINGKDSFEIKCNKFDFCMVMSLIFGSLCTGVGFILLVSTAINPYRLDQHPNYRYIGFSALTAVGAVLLSAYCLLFKSSKCRASIMHKMDKPVSIPTSFKISELNDLLEMVGIDPLPHARISTTKDLLPIYNKIEAALAQTDTDKQIKIGKAVIEAIKTTVFFAGRDRIILDYLISDENILDRIAPKSLGRVIR